MKDISKKNTIADTNPEYQKFIDIFNQSPVSTGIYNTEGKLENINQAYLDLFGIQKPEALKRFGLFTFSPITEKTKADIRSGIPAKFDFEFDFDLAKRQKRYEITRSGKCYFECFINPLIAQDHTIVGYIIQIIEITARKRAEHILLESEFKYRSLIHHSSDPIFSFNPNETYRFVNEAFARHFKKEPEDIIGKTPHDIFSYEEAEKRLTLVRKVFRNGQKGEIEVKVVTPTGDVHYFLTMADPIKNEQGEVIYVTCVSKDITKRKVAEEALAVSEERFRSLYENSTIGLYRTTQDGKIILANPTLVKILGYNSFEELTNRNLEQEGFESTYDRKLFIEQIEKKRYVYGAETAWIRKDGTTVYLRESSKAILDSDGKTLYYDGTVEDITERKLAEKALSITEEKFRRIVENSLSGMYFYFLDQNDRLIFNGANPAADKIMGLSHEPLMGKSIEEAFPNLANTGIPAQFRSIAKGELEAQEFEISYQEGEISGFYSVQVFQTESNTITVHFTDISERKKTEILLKQQATELQKINITKDKFFSIIAHDLKSPFNAIIGFTDLLLTNFNHLDEATLLKGIRTIESASSQAYKLLENLLLWAQNQTGRGQYNPEKLNLNRQIRESIHYIESTALNKGIRIINNIKTDYHIFADKNMIDTILRNLVSNAIKFSYSGSNIVISAIELDGEVNVSVSDNGTGIAPGKLTAIFEIDKRTNTVGTENEQGTGFGLVLCKDFIDRQGGNIWVESTLGKGSTFTFSFPLH
jgi:PAS domain S-box-containing protein